MKILVDNDDITMILIPRVDVRSPWGYYTKVKETGYWYRSEWRWGHINRIKYAGQVRVLEDMLV